jgi:predicted metal-binding protein
VTDEQQPSGDFFDQLNDAADAAMPKLLQRLRDAVEGGGTVMKRHRCTACGETNTIPIEVTDVEETRKIVELFGSLKLRANAQRKDDSASSRARAILRDRSEMTDEELAESIAALELELG